LAGRASRPPVGWPERVVRGTDRFRGGAPAAATRGLAPLRVADRSLANRLGPDV